MLSNSKSLDSYTIAQRDKEQSATINNVRNSMKYTFCNNLLNEQLLRDAFEPYTINTEWLV